MGHFSGWKFESGKARELVLYLFEREFTSLWAVGGGFGGQVADLLVTTK